MEDIKKRWIGDYLIEEGRGLRIRNPSFGFIRPDKVKEEDQKKLVHLVAVAIERCSEADKECILNLENFKKLKWIVINEYGFDIIERLRLKENSTYEYIIFIPEGWLEEVIKDKERVKTKIAHEIAHFYFALQGIEATEEECNDQAEKWGFPKPHSN